MNSRLSIRFDFPDPFGPTTLLKLWWNGPIVCLCAYDLKFYSSIRSIISRAGFRACPSDTRFGADTARCAGLGSGLGRFGSSLVNWMFS